METRAVVRGVGQGLAFFVDFLCVLLFDFHAMSKPHLDKSKILLETKEKRTHSPLASTPTTFVIMGKFLSMEDCRLLNYYMKKFN